MQFFLLIDAILVLRYTRLECMIVYVHVYCMFGSIYLYVFASLHGHVHVRDVWWTCLPTKLIFIVIMCKLIMYAFVELCTCTGKLSERYIKYCVVALLSNLEWVRSCVPAAAGDKPSRALLRFHAGARAIMAAHAFRRLATGRKSISVHTTRTSVALPRRVCTYQVRSRTARPNCDEWTCSALLDFLKRNQQPLLLICALPGVVDIAYLLLLSICTRFVYVGPQTVLFLWLLLASPRDLKMYNVWTCRRVHALVVLWLIHVFFYENQLSAFECIRPDLATAATDWLDTCTCKCTVLVRASLRRSIDTEGLYCHCL